MIEVSFDAPILHVEESAEVRVIHARPCWYNGRALPPHPLGGWLLAVPPVVGRGELTDGAEARPVEIHPAPEKLPPGLFLQMLEELEAADPGLTIGAQPERAGGVGAGGAAPPQALEALGALVDRLEESLSNLCDKPMLSEGHARVEIPVARLRRAGAAEWRALAERPDRARVEVWRAERAAERRWLSYVAARVRQVEGRLAEAAAWLDRRGLSWRARALRAGAGRLQARRARLVEVAGGELAGAGVPDGVPGAGAAAALRWCRFFLWPLFTPSAATYADPSPPLPLSTPADPSAHPAMARPSWQIYELWCALSLRRALAEALPGWEWSGDDPARSGSTWLSGGEIAARGPGGVLRLEAQPAFLGWSEGRSARRVSLSLARRPDLVLSLEPPSLPPHPPPRGRWICLDAKWRAGEAHLGEAMVAAHLYRDALRDRAMGGAPAASLLLAPSRSDPVSHWFDKDFIAEHNVGILEFHPGADLQPAARWLLHRLGIAD